MLTTVVEKPSTSRANQTAVLQKPYCDGSARCTSLGFTTWRSTRRCCHPLGARLRSKVDWMRVQRRHFGRLLICHATPETLSPSPNIVYLGCQDPGPGFWWSRRTPMLGALDDEVRHLALDGAGVVTKPPFRQQFEEQLGVGLTLGVVEDLRLKNPGATPLSGVPPGASDRKIV